MKFDTIVLQVNPHRLRSQLMFSFLPSLTHLYCQKLIITCERHSGFAADDGTHISDRCDTLVDAFIKSMWQTVLDRRKRQRTI